MLSENLTLVCNVAQKLKDKQFKFVIVLTMIDELEKDTELEELIKEVASLSSKHIDFIFPIINCTRQNEIPSEKTVDQVNAFLASVTLTAKDIKKSYQNIF